MYDQFLSNLLKIPVYRIQHKEKEIEEKGLIIARVGIEDIETLEKLLRKKFLPVTIDVYLEKQDEKEENKAKIKNISNIDGREVKIVEDYKVNNDIVEQFLDNVNKLNNLFPTSHFYRSPFTKEKADLVYKSWLKNNLSGRAKNYFAITNNKIIGIISLIKSHIDILFVLPEYRRRKIGSLLLEYVCSSHSKLTVSTQIDNPALYLYLKQGFRIKKLYLTLHKLNL